MTTRNGSQNRSRETAKHISPRIAIPKWYDQYPEICELMRESSTGTEFAQMPSITIFAVSGGVRVCLCDRKRNRSIFRSGETPGDALRAICEAISSGRADWRPKRSPRR
jgi:hypothetical protein